MILNLRVKLSNYPFILKKIINEVIVEKSY